MLLANVTVAEHILRAFPACSLLRRHPVPLPRQFEPLLRAAAAAHMSIDVSSSKVRGFGCQGPQALSCPRLTLREPAPV